MADGTAPKPSAWLYADTWYACDGQFLNARTGEVSVAAPDGLRPNGVRGKSAATAGSWAVPFTSPPPMLPPGLASREDGEAGALDIEPHVESFGLGPSPSPLFTAPHGVALCRDGCREHLPEDFTTYLALALAEQASGRSITWGASARGWSVAHEAPLPNARDPNYLTEEECESNAWVDCVRGDDGASRRRRPRGLHVDLHGKADREGEGDVDVGVGACRAAFGDAAADVVAATLHSALTEALDGTGFAVDATPRLQVNK